MNPRSDSPSFLIRRVDWIRDRAALRYVRTRVLIEEQDVPQDLEWDQKDASALHLLAIDTASRPLGTARLTNIRQIGRMAVLPDWRNRGVGSALLREMLDLACKSGAAAPFLNAQVSALPFYRSRGFEVLGEEFLEAGIPHRRMIFHD